MLLLSLWGLLGLTCYYYGLLFYRKLCSLALISPSFSVDNTELVLAGFGLLVLVSQLLSLFVPVNYYIGLGWLLGAGAIAMAHPKALGAFFKLSTLDINTKIIWSVMTTIVFFYSTLSPDHTDSSIYHLPSIRWSEEYSVVPGLGNLHGRLAFNSSFFVVSSALGMTALLGQTLFPINGFLFLLVSLILLKRIKSTHFTSSVLAAGCLVIIVFYLLRFVFSPTPDIAATLLPLVIFFLWIENKPTFSFQTVLIVLLVFVSITIKLANIPLLLGLLFIAWPIRAQLTLPQVSLVLGIGLLLMIPWVVRNIILSGYLLYPFPGIDWFSVDWKVPLERVIHERDYVAFWAKFRVHESFMNTALLKQPLVEWFPVWWERQGYFFNKPIWVLAVISPLVVVSHWFDTDRRKRFWPVLGPYLVAFGGFVFWFLSAPDFRFGYPFIWFSALAPWAIFLPEFQNRVSLNRWKIGAVVSIMVAASGYFIGFHLIKNEFPIHQYLLIPKPLTYKSVGSYEQVFKPNRTSSGLTIFTPVGAPMNQNCYEVLMSSPFFYPDLKLRNREISEGFRSTLASEKSYLSQQLLKTHRGDKDRERL